jgi:hypothetical protein
MPEGPLSDALILAALERAELHRGRDEPGVLYATVVGHLGLPMGSATGRRLRPRFRELEASGLIRSFKRHGSVVYTLTERGRKRLDADRRAGAVGELPESPQHRAWRDARDGSERRIAEFRAALQTLLDEAAALFVDDAAPSESWFLLGERLQRASVWMGSATHCLREWAEPDDARADVDDGPRRGRRNPGLWRPDAPSATCTKQR